MEKEKKKIQNSFFDLFLFVVSIIFSFFRSVRLFFLPKVLIRKNYFFDFLDYIFRIWSRSFWKKPTLYKLGGSIGDFLNFIFKRK